MVASSAPCSRPSTFQERGVAVPFTTPLLAQARARASRAGGIELTVTNPSGGRGWYVLPAGKVAETVRLTMHDRLLLEQLARLPNISPVTVRAAAREVARAGAAGREAAHAAAEAQAQEGRDRILANAVLIATLLRRSGHAEVDWQQLDLGSEATRVRIKRLLNGIAPRLGMSVDRLLVSIDEIAHLTVPVGLAARPFASRAARTVAALERFTSEVRVWARLEPEDRRPGVELIAACAMVTLEQAKQTLDRLRTAIDAAPQLLRQWSADPLPVIERLALPDWLLDGWPYICASWDQATSEDRSAQRVALARIEGLVPVLPSELAREGGSPEERLHQRRWLRPREDLRSPSAAGAAIGRNEALRAVLA